MIRFITLDLARAGALAAALALCMIASACVVADECTNDAECASGFECVLRTCREVAPPPEPPPCDLDGSEDACPDAGIVEELRDAGDLDPCGGHPADGGFDTGRCG